MFRALTIMTAVVLLAGAPLAAQDFYECADVNQDGSVNIADPIYMINSLNGGPDVPVGRGDVDFRAGKSMGDIRYLIGYIFMGWPVGGCPPFDPYTVSSNDADTVFLPAVNVPAGDGEFALPIVLLNQNPVTDIVVPFRLETLGGTVQLDSVRWAESLPQGIYIRGDLQNGEDGSIGFCSIMEDLDPGLHLLGRAYCSYTGCPGGLVGLDTVSFNEQAFAHYLYGPLTGSYGDLTIAYPTIVSSTGLPFANMSLNPDSLYFQALDGDGDPASQAFTILSDGDPFAWTLVDGPAWIETDKSYGTSGETVTVSVHAAGLNPGTHYGEITVSADYALNSPLKVQVLFKLKAQYPSLDANCDGLFNITDVVSQINYIFGDGVIPCDPCTGEPIE